MGVIISLIRMWFTRTIQPFTFEREHDHPLPFVECENLGLYIHVPFCKNVYNFCPYCKVPYSVSLCDRYINALIQKIHLIGRQHKGWRRVTSPYSGGGTPALTANRIKEIVFALNEYFIITEGIDLELHPSNVRIELLRTLKDASVMKISIDVQSFSDKYQKLLGRKKIDTATLAATLVAVPFKTVPMDLIFVLPGRHYNDLKPDIGLALLFGASHTTMYPFIDFMLTESPVSAMLKKEKRTLLDAIANYCFKKRYSYNSIWTFSSEAASNYSSMTRDNLLGLRYSVTNLFKWQFKINTFNPDTHYKRIYSRKPATSLTLYLTKRQRMICWLLWTACNTKVRAAGFQTFFGVSLKKMYNFELWLAKQFGLLARCKGSYEMTLEGAFYYHYYENFYTLSYIDKTWDIIRKEVFPREVKL